MSQNENWKLKELPLTVDVETKAVLKSLPDSLNSNSLFLISHHVCKWKPSRLAVFRLLQQGMSVADMTSKLDLTDKAIYKTIDQGELKVIRQLFLEIEKIITAFTMQPQRQQSKQKAQQPK